MTRVQYRGAIVSWKSPFLRVIDESGQALLSIPVNFAKSGSCDTIAFVLSQVDLCFEERGYLRREDGVLLSMDDTIPSGKAIFVRNDGSTCPCTPRKGPRFKYKYRAPVDGTESSTMSNSSRSTVNQGKFKLSLISRDGRCLLSSASYEACTGSHILPQSRPEYYEEVLEGWHGFLFEPEYGLLLRSDLHHSFDAADWALHDTGENLVVHVFNLDSPARAYHGKIISPSRFQSEPDDHPNRLLLAFHYQQCSMQRFRAYSAGFDFDCT